MSKTFRAGRLIAAAFLCAPLVFGGCAKQGPGSPDGLDLVVLHTNDTHSHVAGVTAKGSPCYSEEKSLGGSARIAAAIKDAKKKQDNVLALDAGDQFQGTLFYILNKWPMLSDINRGMPYDAATIGNHEFDEGCKKLAAYLEKQPYPMLAANLDPEKGCPLLGGNYKPWIIREVRGVKVGIIGMAEDEVVQLARACEHTKFLPVKDALNRAVKELEKQGVHHIIAVTHLGLPLDREIARTVDGIDIIVGGHTHSYIGPGSSDGPYPIVENSPSGKPVLVVTAKRATQYLGELEVKFDKKGVPASWTGGPKELVNSMPLDPEVAKTVDKYKESLKPYAKVIGRNVNVMADGMDECRQGECLSGLASADAVMAFTKKDGVDIVLWSGGSIRGATPVGDITVGDIMSIHPFMNMVTMKEMTGEVLLAVLEHSVSGENGHGPRLMHPAGLRYTADPSKPVGHRVSNVQILKNGKAEPLSMTRKYRVVTSEYIASGGDDYRMLKEQKLVKKYAETEDNVYMNYLKKHNPLPRPATGRINWVK